MATRLTRRIEMRAPILSSPMDTVTEHRMASPADLDTDTQSAGVPDEPQVKSGRGLQSGYRGICIQNARNKNTGVRCQLQRSALPERYQVVPLHRREVLEQE